MKIGRPRLAEEEEMHQLSIYVPMSLWERFVAEADRRCVARNLLMRRILERHLAEWEKKEV